MNYQINFPHLGIYLEHVGKSISVGGFAIAYYGIAIAVGMLLGIGLVCRRAKETVGHAPSLLSMQGSTSERTARPYSAQSRGRGFPVRAASANADGSSTAAGS